MEFIETDKRAQYGVVYDDGSDSDEYKESVSIEVAVIANVDEAEIKYVEEAQKYVKYTSILIYMLKLT